MNILLLGSGGRESALAWKLRRSRRCKALYIAPGNGGTAQYGQNVPIDPMDFEAVGQFALENKVHMVLVGPEDPLVNGIWDFFQSNERLQYIHVIGPSKAGAQLEGSKAWAKQFMHRHGIPTAAYREFTAGQMEEGLAHLSRHALPVVLKADGLAAGKGVVICHTLEEAQQEFRAMLDGKFGAASSKVVIEQFLEGVEFSVFAVTDGHHYCILPEAKDYKRVGEGDTGLNTGGMGAVSPVPFLDLALWKKTEDRIIKPTIIGLANEHIVYRGFIFFGLIKVGNEPYVIEYNCRMGDPETEVVMPRLRNDLVSLLMHCYRRTLHRVAVRIDARAAATVMLVSGGYPGAYEKGMLIEGLDDVHDSLLMHAGTSQTDSRYFTNGGRVLAVTSYGRTLDKALARSYKNAEKIRFDGVYYRKDIGRDVV